MAKLLTFTTDFAFLHAYLGEHRSPLNGVPKKIFGGRAYPRILRSPSTTPLATAVIFKSKNCHISAMPTKPSNLKKN